MNQILIPTDFTENSRESIFYGVKLARDLNKNVLLLHVVDIYNHGVVYPYPTSMPPQIPPPVVEESEENAKNEFKVLLKDIDENVKNQPRIDYKIEHGLIVEKILKIIHKPQVDMVLLPGRKGTNHISKVNAKIIESADCPVWIIPPDNSYKSFDKIVYATDYNEADIDSLKKLAQIASYFKAYIFALHITNDFDFKNQLEGKGFEETVREKAGYQRIDLIFMPGEKIIDAVDEFARDIDADVIAMLKEDESLLDRIFRRSETKKMVFKSQLPVLVYHEEKK